MVTYEEHATKLEEAAFYYPGTSGNKNNGKIGDRVFKIREIAKIIREHTKDRRGEIKYLQVPILSKQSLIEKLKEHNVTKGLSDSSLMPDLRALESYVGIRYVPAGSDPKRAQPARAGKYT